MLLLLRDVKLAENAVNQVHFISIVQFPLRREIDLDDRMPMIVRYAPANRNKPTRPNHEN